MRAIRERDAALAREAERIEEIDGSASKEPAPGRVAWHVTVTTQMTRTYRVYADSREAAVDYCAEHQDELDIIDKGEDGEWEDVYARPVPEKAAR